MTVTGWRIAEVNAMEYPDVIELTRYWNQFPPVHISLRGLVGSKGSTWNKTETPEVPAAIANLPVQSTDMLPEAVQKFLEETKPR